jgi:hypothetical protein
MSGIPPHGARIIGSWPESHHGRPPARRAPGRGAQRVAHSLLAEMASLARALHLLRAAGPDVNQPRGPGVAPPPTQHA